MISRLTQISLLLAVISTSSLRAQPAKRAASATAHPPATLAQLMRGILFPASNVIFAAQTQDPASIKPAADPSSSPNLLTSTYGKWDAVENSSLALAEVATLLTVSDRKCSNGVDVPLRNPDWAKFVQGLREAGLKAYVAAQSKNQDKVIDAANDVTAACENCHEKYREKPDLSQRCR